MIDAIKQKIERIKNGEIPEGYTCKYHVKPDLWMYEPLDTFFHKVKEKNLEKKFKTVFTNSAVNGVIPQSQYFEKDIANEENTDGYYVVRERDYIYNPRISEKAPYGPISQNLTGCTGIASPLYTVFSKKENVHVCDEYIRYYLCSAEWHKYIYSVANYGARFDRMNISDSDFMKIPIALPQTEEQQKIAEILMQCDKVIKLYEQEIDELKKLKKAYLRKMFPQKGENVPELRFAGFTDPWEQRKLSQVFTIRNEKNVDRYTREDVLAVSDTYGCVNQIQFHGRSFAGEDISNYKVVRIGDIIYTKSPLQAKPYGIIKIVDEEVGIISPLYVVNEVANGIDSLFMYYLFDTPERTNNYLSPLVRKGAKNTMNISNDEWLSGVVTISPNEQEQKAIGQFFHYLDNLITLHQRKLEEQQKQKRSLMQLLLTGIVRV